MREWLRKCRISCNFSMAAAAAKANISDSFYCLIEQGYRQPSPKVAKKIATALNFKEFGLDWTEFFNDTT